MRHTRACRWRDKEQREAPLVLNTDWHNAVARVRRRELAICARCMPKAKHARRQRDHRWLAPRQFCARHAQKHVTNLLADKAHDAWMVLAHLRKQLRDALLKLTTRELLAARRRTVHQVGEPQAVRRQRRKRPVVRGRQLVARQPCTVQARVKMLWSVRTLPYIRAVRIVMTLRARLGTRIDPTKEHCVSVPIHTLTHHRDPAQGSLAHAARRSTWM